MAEVAMSLVLLTGAGLLVRSFVELQRNDPGFRVERLLTLRVSRFISGIPGRELVNLYSAPYAQLAERLRRLPGVTAVGGSYNVPFQDKASERRKEDLFVKGQDARDQKRQIAVEAADVMPGFFDALGIRLLEGRVFTEADDAQSPDVVIVSRTAAETLWPGSPAVGQQLRLGAESPDNRWCRVVGVVSDTRWSALETQRSGEVYYSYRQWPMPAMTFFLRTAGPADPLAAAAREEVKELHPDLAVTAVRTLEQIAGESLWQQRLWGVILASFAALALMLAAVGLYGVMSYLVAQRKREMGIRLALGAQPGEVVLLVLRRGLLLTGCGVTLGLLAARALAGALASQLSGVKEGGVALYGGVALVLIAASAVIPALRAGSTDPLIALRHD